MGRQRRTTRIGAVGLALAAALLSFPRAPGASVPTAGAGPATRATATATATATAEFALTPTGKNVVVILADDLSVGEMQYLPKTQALLAADGVTFTTTYDNTPVCCPARATLLTGQHSRHHGVLTNKPEQGQGYQALDHSNTLATWFRAAGYDTTFAGKYLNGYGTYDLYPNVPDNREVPPGWSNFNGLVGTLKYFNYTLNRNGTLEYHGSRAVDYQTDVLASIASQSIQTSATAGRPFFLWLSPLAPHMQIGAPPVPAPRHRNAFDGIALPQPPNFNEADVTDKPLYLQKVLPLDATAIAGLRTHYEARVETLQALDDAVERVYQTLQSTGKLDDTLIVFASDNGYLFGNHRLEGKVRVYEESSRVPLILRGGPFRGGGRITSLISNIDLAPTIVAHTGITPQRLMDGIDLAGVVAAPAAFADRALLIESVEGPGYTGIRTPTWMWVEYATGSKELYNMVDDPYQLRSLHRSTGLAAVRADLHNRLQALLACAGPTCNVTGP